MRLGLALLLVAAMILVPSLWAEEIIIAEMDPELLRIGTGIGTPCGGPSVPASCLVYDSDGNGIPDEVVGLLSPTLLSLYYQSEGSHPALPDPVLLIIGIPNGVGTPPAITSITGPGNVAAGSGIIGGPNTYGGVWNTVTGFAGNMSSGDAYSTASLNGSPSQSFTNWSAAEFQVNGFTPTFFAIYVYSLTLNPDISPSSVYDIHFGGTGLPVGTFIIANGCSDFSTPVTSGPQAGNCQTSKTYATPFTHAGLTIPEPGSLALFGSGLVMVGAALRRRLGA